MPPNREKDELESEEEKRPYGFFEQSATVRAFHFYISGEIEEPAKYTEMIHQIRTAQPNNAIHIHLNTPGGLLSTGVQLINAMRSSQGHIVTHLEGEVCSMGALLFLVADEMIAYDDCLLMFHNYSGGGYGKGHELRAGVEALDLWYTNLLRNVCQDFLTEDEIKRIIKGEDFWMQADQVKDRLIKMIKILDKKQAARMKKPAPKKKKLPKK